MSDYSPDKLASKWRDRLPPLFDETAQLWKEGKPRRRLFSFGPPESDLRHDQQTPPKAKATLLYHGRVVWGLIARAFFAAYLPGRNTFYGSVVYSLDAYEPDSIFELAWRVNELRKNNAPPPKGTETIARAIRDDSSDFARLRLPTEVDAYGSSYLANLCIQRTRLPKGYLHERLLPILVSPEETEWCCILPLRFWSPKLKEIWLTGSPAYEPAEYAQMLPHYKIQP
jgi:hypothetical protein